MFGRRLLTIPGYLIACFVCVVTIPVWLILAGFVDAIFRNRGATLRSGVFLTYFLCCEVLGIAISAGLWAWSKVVAVESERWADLHYRLEAWWGTSVLRGVIRIFGLRMQIEDAADLGRGPYLLLVRHASSADTLLASALVSRSYGIRLRYLVKRELLWDPCIDIVGNRLPNVFVDRFPEDSAREIRRIQELATGLGPRDGILTHPEGTRFSQQKRSRVLARLQREADAVMFEYARSLQFVLPPRPGGTLGLLEAAPQVDVVVCSHTGFEGAASLAEIWRGSLVQQTIRVHFHRIPRAAIPSNRKEQLTWLLREWQRVDAWVATQRKIRSESGLRERGSNDVLEW